MIVKYRCRVTKETHNQCSQGNTGFQWSTRIGIFWKLLLITSSKRLEVRFEACSCKRLSFIDWLNQAFRPHGTKQNFDFGELLECLLTADVVRVGILKWSQAMLTLSIHICLNHDRAKCQFAFLRYIRGRWHLSLIPKSCGRNVPRTSTIATRKCVSSMILVC